jgi:hypothetical protein
MPQNAHDKLPNEEFIERMGKVKKTRHAVGGKKGPDSSRFRLELPDWEPRAWTWRWDRGAGR